MMGAKGKIIAFVLLLALMATPLGCTCLGNRAPNADFLYSPFAPTTDNTVFFTDNSTDDKNIVSWAWDFGDENTSTLQNPAHLFTSPGIYTVSLTVTDNDGASDTYTANITVSSPPQIGKWDAIEILVGEIIPPASSDEKISAFMLSEPLRAGDVVTSESGEDYPIDANTWFIFIDDQPEALFAHNVRYVFIDAKTADYDIANESWPPEINNFSMWDTQNLGRGHLIEVYSILDSPLPISSSLSDAPSGDYGDAPDGQDAYSGVPGSFPTLFHTTNSLFGRPGGHALNVGGEMLGLKASAEVDATDPNDPDGVPNLVDADGDERMYVIMEGTKARLAFTVTVSLIAPDVTRYANALIDFDYSGNWSESYVGAEWVVVNLEVNVDPGASETIITPEFSWGNQVVPPSPVWMRVSLTREKVDEDLFANIGGWDGSGQFGFGEIEDHLVFLTDNPSSGEE
jgi:PKD repeat protein